MNDIDQLALAAAQTIENMYYRDWLGGRPQRLAAIQAEIAETLQRFWDRKAAEQLG